MYALPKRYLVVGGLAAAVAAAGPDAGAQSTGPCPAGTATPNVTTADREAGAGGALTATHTIDLDADFGNNPSPDSFTVSAPAGVTVRSHGPSGATIVSDLSGALPITLSWTQFQPDGTECTASMGMTLQLQAATPLSFGKLPKALRPKFRRYSAGYAPVAVIGRYTDRRPVELRLRGIARPKLPSPSMPFKTVTVALRALDPGFGNQRFLRSPKWQVTGSVNYKATAFFLESRVKTGSIHDHPIGYELQVLQGGRLMLRVREAGKCNFAACSWRTVKVQRGT